MSDSRSTKQIVRDYLQAVWGEGKLDELAAYWTEDCVNHAAPIGEQHGLVSLREYHRSFMEMMGGLSNISSRMVDQIAEGDRVVSYIVTTADHTEGEFMGRQPTGQRVTNSVIRIDRIVAGRIAEHWSVFSFASE